MLSRLFNSKKSVLRDLNERKPLPTGMTAFEEWSDRIAAATPLSISKDSIDIALATMIMHLGPQESHKEDAYFVHSLLRSAAQQIAHAKLSEIKDRLKSLQKPTDDIIVPAKQPLKIVAEQATQPSAVTPTPGVSDASKVLGNDKL